MCTANSTFTVEELVAKYRDYVMEHCPKSDRDTSISPDGNADEQLLATLYSIVAGSNADAQVVSALSSYSQKFMEAALEREELAFLCEHFKEFVAYEFSERDSWNIPCSFWEAPSYIYDVIKELARPEAGQTIFIADAGYGDVASLFPGCTVKGFTGIDNQEIWALGQIRLYAAGVMSEIVCGSLDGDCNHTLPKEESADIVIYGNVWLTKHRDLQPFNRLLKENGRMLMLLARGALAGKEYEFSLRQQLINDKNIQAIISFENDRAMDGDCDDWFSSHYVLLDIEKTANEEVCLVNMKKQTSKVIDSDLLNPEILWPSYYDATRPQNGVPLSEIVTVPEEETLSDYYLIEQHDKSLLENKDMPLVLPKDLGNAYTEADLRHKKVSSFKPSSGRLFSYRHVSKPCVLISEDTEKLKVGYIKPVNERLAYEGCRCLIPQSGIDIRYVAALLFDHEVKEQIQTIFDGIIWDNVLPLVLDKIIVPNHNEKDRLNYLAEANYEALVSSRERLTQEADHYQKAVRMRKHALTQSLSAVEAMFYALNAHRNRQNGTIADDEVISRIKGTTVQEAFEFISKNLQDMMPALEHIADIKHSFGTSEWIDPETFIKSYVTKEENGWLTFDIDKTDWEKDRNKAKHDIKNKGIKKGQPLKTFWFPKDALERIFNDIVANAQAHGFTDASRKYLMKFSWYTHGQSLIIEIANNGTPIPEDRDTASLLEYGVSSALHHNGHNGIGCNEIDDIMKRYDGNVEIVSSPQNDYTVKYVLTFNRINVVGKK